MNNRMTDRTDKFVVQVKQQSRAVAREPRDAATVVFGLKFADNIHYKFKRAFPLRLRFAALRCDSQR